jgi:SecD/SecF fusion protein
MKRSLTWRWVLNIAVIGGWIAALFPLRDRDFLKTFEKLSRGSVAKLEAKAAKSDSEAKALQAKLDAMTDKESEAFKGLQADREKARLEAEQAKAAADAYPALLARAAELRAKNPELAQYRSLEQAARGDETQTRVKLSAYIAVPGAPTASNKRVLKYVRDRAAGKLHLGLDLQGGTEFVISFSEEEVREKDREVEPVRDQIIEILRNRLDMMGLTEPEIKPVGANTISVRMPTLSEGSKADIRDVLKQQANLQFFLVDPNNDTKVQEYHQKGTGSFQPSPGYEYREVEREVNGETVTDVIFTKKTPENLDGSEVSRARPTPSQFGNWWSVSLEFKSRGARQFAKITTDHVNEQLAIVMDNKVYSAPNIREPITQGNAEITGSFTVDEAKRLAGVIESGNLPVNIRIDSEFGTDPTLGSDSIRSGIWASVSGMTLVALFMIWYYRFAGVVAIVALLANTVLILGTMTLSRATITLPGIAGLVLSIGMAVDANVLIYERIREELRHGKTIGNAIKAGYDRAFVTILDSNLTTLLSAIILYQFGTGSLKGFGVTLGIGLVANMFTAVFLTRTIFDTYLATGRLQTLKMRTFKAITECNYDFLSMIKPAVIGSVVVCVLALVAVVGRGRSCLSIDFAGGTEIAYEAAGSQPPVADVRTVLDKAGYGDARIGYKFHGATGMRMLEVVLPKVSTDRTGQVDFKGLEESLNTEFPTAKIHQVRTTSVGNLVGAQFQWRAIWATLLSFLGIIIYVAFRFELAYGVAGVVALVHDTLIAGGIYLLLGWFDGSRQLSLPVVAALLTIIGFSINDTIVTFDRVREALGLYRDRSYRDIVNLSINECLSRTALTSLTVLFTVLTLFLFGGGAINDFSLVMLLGVIVGTYSTVFIAAALILVWHKPSRLHKDEPARGRAKDVEVEEEVAAAG